MQWKPASGWMRPLRGIVTAPTLRLGIPQLYPCPGMLVSMVGFAKTGGDETRVGICPQNRNLATAVQVSIDTAMRHLEVCNSVARVQPFESP